jgi:hypothetical protein
VLDRFQRRRGLFLGRVVAQERFAYGRAMETPLQITFRGFQHTPDLDQLIRRRT